MIIPLTGGAQAPPVHLPRLRDVGRTASLRKPSHYPVCIISIGPVHPAARRHGLAMYPGEVWIIVGLVTMMLAAIILDRLGAVALF